MLVEELEDGGLVGVGVSVVYLVLVNKALLGPGVWRGPSTVDPVIQPVIHTDPYSASSWAWGGESDAGGH